MTQRYEKLDLLSSSSDGRVRVHRGLDRLHSHRPIALKFQLHYSLAYANLTLREALNQARLTHPNVCQVLDCQVTDLPSGQVETTLVLELMEDGDLMKEIESRMRTGRKWQEKELLAMLEKLLLALIYAQESGICHRDIKPQNVFLHRETCLKVGDFGSSTALADADLAASFSLQGSPFYLSPELKSHYINYLASGQTTVRHDPYKSDVYSLGVMVLFMARLKAPFELANLDRLREKTDLLLLDCGEYPLVQTLLGEMLEIDPEKRISLVNLLKMMKKGKFAGESEKKSAICPANEDNDTCLYCKVPHSRLSQSDLPTFLPCNHFYHDIVCLYQALKEASQGFSLSVDYQCSRCQRRIPDETLEKAFSAGNCKHFGRLGEMKKCVICKGKPALLVQECKHARCLQCAGLITQECPCSTHPSACVLS